MECTEKTTDMLQVTDKLYHILLSQVTDKLYHILLYLVHLTWAWFQLPFTTLVLKGIDCICSCKSCYLESYMKMKVLGVPVLESSSIFVCNHFHLWFIYIHHMSIHFLSNLYHIPILFRGPSWSYGNRIYNYICNQYLSTLMLWMGVGIMLMWGVLDTTICDKKRTAFYLWWTWETIQLYTSHKLKYKNSTRDNILWQKSYPC
jgi:hypothetical protein